MTVPGLRSAFGTPMTPDTRQFECCDTQFRLAVRGWRSRSAADRAVRTARGLEAQLNAFAPDSAVSRLHEAGTATNRHVAALVRRGLEYRDRTDGAFDVTRGRLEHGLKAYIREERDSPPASAGHPREFEGTVEVSGATVRSDVPLDLNGLAKGYVVDRTHEALSGPTRRGFVDGGGDVANPTGGVEIESPYGDSAPLKTLDTQWNVASSAGYRRRRGDVDHIYDPETGRPGSRHDVVTVVAERDCTEADALATALSVLPTDDAVALVEDWPGAEALVVHGGVFHRSMGFADHVA